MSATRTTEAIWHEVECGAYAADLATWVELGREARGPVLELGAGGGRVALQLAKSGIEVVALDRSRELLDDLEASAVAAGLEIETVRADARRLRLEREFGAVLAPMQFMHLLAGPPERRELLAAIAGCLRPGGTFAAALLAEDARAYEATAGAGLLPDVREIGGWVYSSLPLQVAGVAGGFELRRLRQIVSPAGELAESTDAVRLATLSLDQLESEAASAGLEPRERIAIDPTADHVGSVVCVLKAPR